MAIPESQLETWSHQGAVATAKATHESIRSTLQASGTIPTSTLDVYLQGSYRNSTNIRGDSDVDVVVELTSVFISDLGQLSTAERTLYQGSFNDAAYGWSELRGDVKRALELRYGTPMVREGDKSIKVQGSSSRLDADVVPAIEHRRYTAFVAPSRSSYVQGMCFFTRSDHRLVVNYPKQHWDNGVSKNGRTSEAYKQSVRMFKNARSRLEASGEIAEGLAPSYFLECLLYNVPDTAFSSKRQLTYVECLAYLMEVDLSTCICQNEQIRLFGESPEQWSQDEARQLLMALWKLWSDW